MVEALAWRPAGSPKPHGVTCVVAALAVFGALTAPGCGDDSADSENPGAASGGTPATQGGSSGATSATGGKAGAPNQQTGGTAAGTPSGGNAAAQGGSPPSDTNAGASADGGATDPSGGADSRGGRDGSDAGATGQPGGAGGLGAGGEGGTGGAEGLTIDEFCELLQPRARAWLRACRFNFGDASGWWGTENIDRFCTSGRAAVAAGRLSYDPIRAAACAEKSVGDCTTIAAFAFQVSNGFQNAEECQGVVVGNVPSGGECYASTRYSSECAHGVCGGETCPGHCQGFVSLGDDCDSETPCDPAEGLCVAGTCEAYPGPNEPCALDSYCAPGLLCVGDVEPSPTCLEPRAVGETCQAEAQCAGGVCRSGKCTDKVALNEPCNSDGNCPAGAYCEETCKPRLALLADCDTTVPCLEGAECRDGTCQVLGDAGDTCPCAYDLWCDDTNHCRNPGELEADCSRSDELNLFNRCAAPLVCRPREAGEPVALACLPPAAEGEPCRPQFAYTCQAPLFCHPSTALCRAPAAEDQACNPALALDSCQAGLSCRCTSNGCAPGALGSGVCRPRVENGEDCASNSECRSAVCSAQKCIASPGCP